MSEPTNAPVAAEVAEAATAVEDKKEAKTENMEVDAPAADAPSDDASTESSPVAEKATKGKAKAPAKKKAAAAPKKAAAAAATPKKAAAKRTATVVAASPSKSAAASAAASPKVKAAPAAKKTATKEASSGSGSHPPYLEMIVAAVEALKERNGSSRQAILKYITSTYELGVDAKMANVHLKQALKRGVGSGTLKNTKVSLIDYLNC